MYTFEVQDMTCGRCASRITDALRTLDPQARVDVDVARRMVTVRSTATLDAVEAAVRRAGYSPRVVVQVPASQAGPARRGCCCAARA